MEERLKISGKESLVNVESEESVKSYKKFALILVSSWLGAIAGRVALQHIPSVEPITAYTIFSAFFFGYRFIPLGISAFYVSNFLVWGGQGPWTPFQLAGIFFAGLAGYSFSKFSLSGKSFFLSLLFGTALYETAVNIGFGVTTGLLSPFIMFIPAIPFSLVHLASTISFGTAFYSLREAIEKEVLYEFKILACRLAPAFRNNTTGKHYIAAFRLLSFRKFRDRSEAQYMEWQSAELSTKNSGKHKRI